MGFIGELPWRNRGKKLTRDQAVPEHDQQVERAKRILEAAVRQRYGSRKFAYIRFHELPATSGIRQIQGDARDEVREVTVSHSGEFSPEEVQLCIFLGVNYLAIDWDLEMTQTEKAELSRKKVQDQRWKWRRGWFVNDAHSSSQS